jgi:hypothetical protein
MLVAIDRLHIGAVGLNARVIGSIQYRPAALTLLSLPHKNSANAYNISNRHFASGLGIADAVERRLCPMFVHGGELPRRLA